MPRATRSSTGHAIAFAPKQRSAPCAGKRPAIAPSSVVLPAPFGPITVTIDPGATASDTSRTASTLPYATDKRSTSSTLAGLALTQRHRGRPRPPRVALDRFRRALGQLLAEIHHDQAVGQAHDELHVVLHQQYRHPSRCSDRNRSASACFSR
jgi:hypothetical protein